MEFKKYRLCEDFFDDIDIEIEEPEVQNTDISVPDGYCLSFSVVNKISLLKSGSTVNKKDILKFRSIIFDGGLFGGIVAVEIYKPFDDKLLFVFNEDTDLNDIEYFFNNIVDNKTMPYFNVNICFERPIKVSFTKFCSLNLKIIECICNILYNDHLSDKIVENTLCDYTITTPVLSEKIVCDYTQLFNPTVHRGLFYEINKFIDMYKMLFPNHMWSETDVNRFAKKNNFDDIQTRTLELMLVESKMPQTFNIHAVYTEYNSSYFYIYSKDYTLYSELVDKLNYIYETVDYKTVNVLIMNHVKEIKVVIDANSNKKSNYTIKFNQYNNIYELDGCSVLDFRTFMEFIDINNIGVSSLIIIKNIADMVPGKEYAIESSISDHRLLNIDNQQDKLSIKQYKSGIKLKLKK